MEVSEAEAQQALDSLKAMNLVIESSGGRVPRYTHNTERVLQVPAASVAVLAVLMLRGPQTAGELRINCDRLYKFADISAVEGFLHELAERPAGALVVELARQPGSRENRWAHLLSGTLAREEQQAPAPPSPPAQATGLAALESRVAALEADMAQLKELIAALRGTSEPG